MKQILLISIILLTGCSNPKHIIDHDQLASRYYQNDAQWYLDNIPFFECSDKKIEEVYYYRWKLYKSHIRDVGRDWYVITEFIDHVDWDRDGYCSINAAAGHHIYEGRWLKNQCYMDGYIKYLYQGAGNDHLYSENVADAAYSRYLVNADIEFATGMLGFMESNYNMWIKHWFDRNYDVQKNLYFIAPGSDATEFSIADLDGARELTKDGPVGTVDAFRPSINSYMYANAMAISKLAAHKGDDGLSKEYARKAGDLRTSIITNLWNEQLKHFTDRYHRTSNDRYHYWDFVRGRELLGYVPWCYSIPDDKPKYNSSWKYVTDTTKLLGKYGLRTVEPSYKYYKKQWRYGGDNGKADCQWNGFSWPYQECQLLTGMANLLNNYHQDIVAPSDYLKILRLYANQHFETEGYLNLKEEYEPDLGGSFVNLRRSHHYNHSTFDDLVITGLCGIRPSECNTLAINPIIDESIRYFCISDVLYHGHLLTVLYDADGSNYQLGKGLTVFVDGKKAVLRKTEGRYKVEIGAPVLKTVAKSSNYALNIWQHGFPVPSASVNNIPDSLYKAIDGRTWYFTESSIANRWTTVGSTSSTDWYALDFGEPHEVSQVRLSLYTDDKTYGLPSDISVEYWDNKQWYPVTLKGNYRGLKENTGNLIAFNKVLTSRIRINLTHSGEKAVAVAELECH